MKRVCSVAYDIASGMALLHKRSVVHGGTLQPEWSSWRRPGCPLISRYCSALWNATVLKHRMASVVGCSATGCSQGQVTIGLGLLIGSA